MFLGLDLGTTNVKALLTAASGKVCGQGSAPVQLVHVGEGGVEQDIEEIWQSACTAIRRAINGIDPAQVRALGISSQGGALQLSAPDGKPLGPVISWLDQRGRPQNEAITRKLGEGWFAQRIGHLGAGLAVGQLLRLAQENPSAAAAPNRVGFVGDVILGRLTGRCAHDGTSAGLTLLYNPTLRAYDPDVLPLAGVAPDRLPDLVPPKSPAGVLSKEAGGQTGLPAGIPVSTAVHDQYAAALAAGAVRPGTTMLGTGTAWVLLAVTDRLTSPVARNAFVCHHVVQNLYGQILSMVNGGSALGWALNLVGKGGISKAEIDALLAAAPPGSGGLQAWPFLAASSPPGLGRGTKGRLAGLQFSHQPLHLLRAIIEGLACELNRHLLMLRNAGIPIGRIVMTGAAAESQVTPQIVADITGLPITRAPGATSAHGAAILARGLTIGEGSLAELAQEMSPGGAEVPPGSNRKFYLQHFTEYVHSMPGDAASCP